MSAALKGADAVMVAAGNVVSEYWLMSKPEVKTGAQLKGGSVAIATFGGLSDSLSRVALQKLGLNPAKDVTLADRNDPGAPERVGVGKGSGRYAQRTRQLQGPEKRTV